MVELRFSTKSVPGIFGTCDYRRWWWLAVVIWAALRTVEGRWFSLVWFLFYFISSCVVCSENRDCGGDYGNRKLVTERSSSCNPRWLLGSWKSSGSVTGEFVSYCRLLKLESKRRCGDYSAQLKVSDREERRSKGKVVASSSFRCWLWVTK